MDGDTGGCEKGPAVARECGGGRELAKHLDPRKWMSRLDGFEARIAADFESRAALAQHPFG